MRDAPDITTLTLLYLDEQLTPEQESALRGMLAADPAARRAFVALCTNAEQVHATLNEQPAATAPVALAEPAPIVAKVRLRRAVVALAASLLLAACGLAIIALLLHNRQSTIDNRQSPPPPLASVTDVIDGTLVIDDRVVTAGNEYAGRSVSLDVGEAEFMLRNRVTVKLRGPTSLTIHDAMNVSMANGSVKFDCPPGAKGYTVHLPNGAKVVDLGTRFGVTTGPDGLSVVTVDEGRVSVVHGRGGIDRVFTAGQRVRLTATGFEFTEPEPRVVSFNLRSRGGTPMGPSETAGAPGINVAAWNDVLAAADGTTLTAGSILDRTGHPVAGMAMTLSAPSSLIDYPGLGAHDARMFTGAIDGFGSTDQEVDGVSDLTATITGIPYAAYDVYVYFPGTGNQSAWRGGEVWADGIGAGPRRSLRHLGDFPQASYVEVDSAAAFSNTTTPQGTYVVFRGMTGSTLTLDWDAEVRFPVAGLQIVEIHRHPDPTSRTDANDTHDVSRLNAERR